MVPFPCLSIATYDPSGTYFLLHDAQKSPRLRENIKMSSGRETTTLGMIFLQSEATHSGAFSLLRVVEMMR